MESLPLPHKRYGAIEMKETIYKMKIARQNFEINSCREEDKFYLSESIIKILEGNLFLFSAFASLRIEINLSMSGL